MTRELISQCCVVISPIPPMPELRCRRGCVPWQLSDRKKSRPSNTKARAEEQYDAFLVDYGPGDYGEAELEPGENRLTVRNRFKAAAVRRGLDLTFQRTTGNLLRFRMVPVEAAPEVEAAEPEPPPTPQAAPKGRGGRRKAAAAAVG